MSHGEVWIQDKYCEGDETIKVENGRNGRVKGL